MYQADTAGVIVKLNDEGTRWERPTSGRKVRANRRNGRLGRGPMTDSGKRRSSQNSLKHGVLASGLTPVAIGPFAEDEDEFWNRVDLIVEALDPSDALEERLAREVAAGLIRIDRLDLLETAAHESAARISAHLRQQLDKADALDEMAGHARGLYYYLAGAVDLEEVPYEKYAVLMRSEGPEPGFPLKGFWDDDHRPKSDEEWKKAFNLLMRTLWGDDRALMRWALEVSQRLADEWAALEGREKELIADRILDNTFEKVTRYHGRAMNDIAKTLDLLRTVRSMKQKGAGSNEPN